MKKHKNKFIAAAVILAVLAGAWFLGGVPAVNTPTPDETRHSGSSHSGLDPESSYYSLQDKDVAVYAYETYPPPVSMEIAGQARNDSGVRSDSGVITPNLSPGEMQIFAAHHYAMREPVEPEDMIIGDGSFTVTLSVRAHTILYNMHLLDRDKHELVPTDGWIFPPTEVTAYEGESVFNVLQREMRRNRIHMVSRWTPIFNSAYIEAINNIFEFDVGPLSGWMYMVNGWFPNFGASRYLLSDGDVIELLYTVDLGRDLGVYWLGGEVGE